MLPRIARLAHRPTQRIGAVAAGAVLLALLAAPVLLAQGTDTWNERIRRSERLLLDGRFGKAYGVTRPLLDEVGGTLLAGENSYSALGSVLALHALAEAGTGREEKAIWHWYLAQDCKPELRTASLEAYGEAGRVLDPHRWEESGDSPPEVGADAGRGADGPAKPSAAGGLEGFEPPRKIYTPGPTYPQRLRRIGLVGRAKVAVVLDETGTPTRPRIVDADHPLFGYLAAEAIRTWRFEPARRDGEPISVDYTLTVNFNERGL